MINEFPRKMPLLKVFPALPYSFKESSRQHSSSVEISHLLNIFPHQGSAVVSQLHTTFFGIIAYILAFSLKQ
jgi:hypothetical protein